MMTSHGLIIGKFYPLHDGHLALIRFAAERSERLSVLLMASRFESVTIERRADWLKRETAGLPGVRVLSIPCDAPVDYGADIAWHANIAGMRAALSHDDAPPVTAVFSSELYGRELAEHFGVPSIAFDVDRRLAPVSGSGIRSDLAGRWQEVAPAARLDLATRIIVVGAESTGTTTLARDLTTHFRTHGFRELRDVEEYGREFTVELHRAASELLGRPAPLERIEWRSEHFAHIARVQTAREDAAALACPLVIADTDAFATEQWERRYVGEHSRAAAAVNAEGVPPRAVYFVTDHVGVPFAQDGWRDGEHLRAAMTSWFIEELTRRGQSWVLLRGDRAERLRYARTLVEALWEQASTFASPPWADRTSIGPQGREHPVASPESRAGAV